MCQYVMALCSYLYEEKLFLRFMLIDDFSLSSVDGHGISDGNSNKDMVLARIKR